MKVYGKKDGLDPSLIEKIETVVDIIGNHQGDLPIFVYYGYPFFEMDNSEIIMKVCIICSKGFVVLYSDESEKTVYSRHLVNVMTNNNALYQKYDDLGTRRIIHLVQIDDKKALIGVLEEAENCFEDNEIRIANIVIQKVYGINHPDNRVINNQNSIGEIIKNRNNEISALDETQFEMIYDEVKHHTRIRGLAGSGKTILLVKKMAYLHYRYPEYEMAYVFYTKSLKQYIIDLFERHYHDYAPNRKPNMDKIHILHSWGGADIEGFYSRACDENKVQRQKYSDINGTNRFDKVCESLLKEIDGKSKPLYDFIFVDEAQDFSINFFRLALATLRFNGKMIYAYDELQALNDYQDTMPSKQEIFGDALCDDINLKVCYRTPKKILVSAHALGLGIYKKKKDGTPDVVNMMQDTNIWTEIGYKVEWGQLSYGCEVCLSRDDVITIQPEECVDIRAVEKIEDQYHEVAKDILNLIASEDILAEDIMIIDLNSIKLQENYEDFKKVFSLEKKNYFESNQCTKGYKAANMLINATTHCMNKDNAIRFKREGSIPYTSIFRAKGNEANIVYIINAQTTSSMESFSRNRLFTAMTRARFRVSILGVESPAVRTLISEYDEVNKHNYMLCFNYPTLKELEKIRTIAKEDAENAEAYGKAYQNLKGRTQMTVEILKEQLGASSMEELIQKLQGFRNEEQ